MLKTPARVLLLTSLGLTACGTDGPALGSSGPGGGKADGFEEFLEQVYCEPDSNVCIVEGDLPLVGEEALHAYFRAGQQDPGALSVYRQDGVDHLWSRTDRQHLTYCVSSTAFTPDEYRQMVEGMAAATAEWEAVAHVDFRHVVEEDGRCTTANPRIVFPVAPGPADAPYIARAFFPQYAKADRAILMRFPELEALRQSYPEATLVGILRHELGHTLGFRHEHIRPENTAWCNEDEDFRPITAYDKKSTMHYPFCDGEGDWSLQLTELDAIGAGFFYPNWDQYAGDRCGAAELRADGTVDPSCAPIVHELLELANTASFEILDVWARLDRRAAEEIVARRGSAPFTTLAQLDAIPYIGPVAVRRMYDYLYVSGRCPTERDVDGLVDARCRPVVHRLLALANTASRDELDHAARLDSRAANNIVALRASRPFTSLVELWGVPYVKATALARMYDYLY